MYSGAAEDGSGRKSSMWTRDKYTAAQTWPVADLLSSARPGWFSAPTALHGDPVCQGEEGPRMLRSAGFALLKLALQAHHLRPHLHYSSSRSSGTRQTRPSADVQWETTACWQQSRFFTTSSPFWRLAEPAAAAAPDAASFALICVFFRRDSCTPVNVRSHPVTANSCWETDVCSRPPPPLSRCLSFTFFCRVSKPAISLESPDEKRSSQMNACITYLA